MYMWIYSYTQQTHRDCINIGFNNAEWNYWKSTDNTRIFSSFCPLAGYTFEGFAKNGTLSELLLCFVLVDQDP